MAPAAAGAFAGMPSRVLAAKDRAATVNMTDYRWNVAETATDYDRIGPRIHPYYAELQDELLGRLPFATDAEIFVVDVGGGSGRLVEKLLQRFPKARALVVDQSEAFLTLAAQRLEAFGNRADFLTCRLQEDWTGQLSQPPAAILSMSAIHHLDPQEKCRLYKACHDALAQGGVLMNADEVRHEDAEVYLQHMTSWAGRMRELAESEKLSQPMRRTLADWKHRNVDTFGAPKNSGDDCHETVQTQLAYLRDGGFAEVSAPWQKEMWAVLRAIKPRAK